MKKNKEEEKYDEFLEKLEKFRDDSYTSQDYKEIVNFFKKPRFQFTLQQGLYRIWRRIFNQNIPEDEQVCLRPSLDRIHHRIGLYEEAQRKHSMAQGLVRIFSKIAAILFIPLIITSGFLIYDKYKDSRIEGFVEINVPNGSRIKTQLPDGSTVWLNSGTTLRYPQNYNKRNRMAEISGEAYFDITPDRMHPFIVRTNMLDIKVLGTSFNIMAYPDQDIISATIEKGRVSIEQSQNGEMVKRFCFLEPGQRMIYSKTDARARKFKTDTEKYTSWKDGKLIFRNDPLHCVIKRLERWYHVDIEVLDPTHELPQHPFTLTIENETLPHVLEYLSVASPIKWEVIPPEYKDNGEISVSKYIILKR